MEKKKIAVIGLGYVGLPLAVEFSKKYDVIGFDINEKRVADIQAGFDKTLQICKRKLDTALLKLNITNSHGRLSVTSKPHDLVFADIYIVTIPTPIDIHNRPDLSLLIKATEMIGQLLNIGNIVIYESTVYPGVTEDIMVPILEKKSGLIYNKEFYCGYSPERINPGDKEHTLTNIKKITSGSNPLIAETIDLLYASIIEAGTYKVSSIKVAEAAKVIENAQRDINIAFVNELSKIFNAAGIDTNEVLDAAATKWNFLKFKPGLVGGHCIGVDPYYLAQKAQELGYHPEIILAGRKLNDSMGVYVAEQVVKLMVKKEVSFKNARCLILGFTFKENCPDFRNTKVIDIVNELKAYSITPVVCDPWINSSEALTEYGITILNQIPEDKYEAIVLAVAHQQFSDIRIRDLLIHNGVLFDVKGIFPKEYSDARL